MMKDSKWEDIVRKELANAERALSEGDWNDFLVRAKAKERHSWKVMATTLACGSAAAAAVLLSLLPFRQPSPMDAVSEITSEVVPNGRSFSAETESDHENPAVEVAIKKKSDGGQRQNRSMLTEKTNETPVNEGIPVQDIPATTDDSESSEHSVIQKEDSRLARSTDKDFIYVEDHERKNREQGISIGIMGIVNRGANGGSGSLILDGDTSGNDGNNNSSGTYEYSHRRPVTFGLSVGYNLTSWMSIVSGVEYSYYKSSVYYDYNKNTYKQKAEYLGIPLRIDCRMLRAGGLSIYTGAGAKADWCLRVSNDRFQLTDNGLNWTIYAAIGAQYEILNGVNIYFEPEMSYYLNNNRDVHTYRTENPLMISAVMGLRFSIGSGR